MTFKPEHGPSEDQSEMVDEPSSHVFQLHVSDTQSTSKLSKITKDEVKVEEQSCEDEESSSRVMELHVSDTLSPSKLAKMVGKSASPDKVEAKHAGELYNQLETKGHFEADLSGV